MTKRTYEYYGVEYRIYRAFSDTPTQMDLWSADDQQWAPYTGDAARVLWQSARYGRTCPPLPKPGED